MHSRQKKNNRDKKALQKSIKLEEQTPQNDFYDGFQNSESENLEQDHRGAREFQNNENHVSRDQQKMKKRSKKSNSKKNSGTTAYKSCKFIDDEAGEGSESESERGAEVRTGQYYEEKDLKRRNKDFSEKLQEVERRVHKRDENIKLKRQRKNAFVDEEEADSDSYEEDGYKVSDDEQINSRDNNQTRRRQKGCLPSTSDPKLWQVGVKCGQEKIATMALINKSVDFSQKGKPLEILSATCIDHIENYIFVEAYRKNSVSQAIDGLNFFINSIEMLSLDEMAKMFQNLNSIERILPEPGNWVRIKQTLYDKDIGIVEQANNHKALVKLFPRVDPNTKQTRVFQKGYMNRQPKRAFQPTWKGAFKTRPSGFNKHFYQWNGATYRKGLLYKTFTIKQLEAGPEIKPTYEERQQFLEVFEQNCNERDGDSSENDAEETRQFLKSDSNSDLVQGDKIRVVFGELVGAQGIIKSVKHNQIDFKPTNLEGYTDILTIEKNSVVKYFDVGDSIRIIHGKYSGETGIVIDASKQHDNTSKAKMKKQSNVIHPLVKFDSTQREMRVNSILLKLKTDQDELLFMTKFNNQQNQKFLMGDVIQYNKSKHFGFVIQVQCDLVKVVNDMGTIERVLMVDIDKMVPFDPKAYTRDRHGNIVQYNDVVKVQYGNRFLRGVVKNICKQCIFLWDEKEKDSKSGGIISEFSRNVSLMGQEFFDTENNQQMGFQNKLIRHWLVGKLIVITKGYYKGQKGRVTKVNGMEAIIELITGHKKISIQKDFVTTDIDDVRENGGYNDGFSGYGNGGNSAYMGQTPSSQMCGVGGGKTPLMNYDAPIYGMQTPHGDRNWGGKTNPYEAKNETKVDWGAQEEAKESKVEADWGQDNDSQPANEAAW